VESEMNVMANEIILGDVALEVKNLKLIFRTYAGSVKALDGIDFKVRKGEILGLVGESGCGKSVTALSIAGLLPESAEVLEGEILLNGEDLLKKDKKSLRIARLTDIAFVFQDPMTYLNPVFTIGAQISEIFGGDLDVFKDELIDTRLGEIASALSKTTDKNESAKLSDEKAKLEEERRTGKLSSNEGKRLAKLRALQYLSLVKLPEPERVYKMYPFELSGGMRQRAMIAMALVRSPKVLLADEITTALDVTVQAQILELLNELRNKIQAAVIIITHDLGVVAQTCDTVAVMYAGNIVEVSSVDELFRNPLHPYTKGLLAAVPRISRAGGNLESITGSVPDLIYPPSGCRFHPRCPMAMEKCLQVKPTMVEPTQDHRVECFLYGG
jgi:oligopeptide/dipeptide ABC transporter ATP-binding protein